MSIYQRGENWYIDFYFHGQRIREMIGPSRKGAEKVIAKRKAEIAENKYLDKRKDPEAITLHDFAKIYLPWSLANKKPSARTREPSLLRNLDKEFGEKELHNITTWQIEKWKAARKAKVKISSVNRELALLKTFFSKAIEWGKCKENPARKVMLFKGETKRLRFLIPEEVQTLLSNCANHLRPIVELAVNTGMRKSEILDLRREQVNFEQGIVTLTDTKNSQRRDVPLNETAKTALRSIKEDGPFYFRSPAGNGKPYTQVHRCFHAALKKSGIEDFRFHDLRHTFASNLVMSGEDLNTVRELLGHSDLKMTLRYAHLAPNCKTRAVSKLDQLWSQESPHENTESAKVLELKRKSG